MNAGSYDELLEQARALDAEAARLGEEGGRGRELRSQAAELRRSALGPRVYPVLVCARCFHLTGWTYADGSCDECARHAAITARDAASFPVPSSALPSRQRPPAVSAGARLAARLGRRRGLDELLGRRWIETVSPGETGPIDPEPGYRTEVAVRDEVERLDGAGVIVRFSTLTAVFGETGWVRLPSTRIGRSLLPHPAEFPADLPIEVLAEAWGDYGGALDALNRRRFAEESAERDASQTADIERERALREQAHTSELLRE